MKNFARSTIVTRFFPACLVFLAPLASVAQTINATCVNPTVTVPLIKQGIDGQDKGQASSPLVQFNINLPGSKGAIFVNEANDGVCTIRISSGYRLQSGRGKIDPTNISNGWKNGGHGNDPAPPISNAVLIPSCIQQEVDTLKCSVKFQKTSNVDELMGTINVNWIVDYVRVN